jgi:hypothetical protein
MSNRLRIETQEVLGRVEVKRGSNRGTALAAVPEAQFQLLRGKVAQGDVVFDQM